MVVVMVVVVVKMDLSPGVEQGTDGLLTILAIHRYLVRRKALRSRYRAEPSSNRGWNTHFEDARLEPAWLRSAALGCYARLLQSIAALVALCSVLRSIA